jgi:hypothetical protein
VIVTGKIVDWEEKADDAFTYLHQGQRAFPPVKMLLMIDKMAVRGSVKQTELVEDHFSENFIATTLSNVTTAVHGSGTVPKDGGWYRRTTDPYTYHVHDAFALAWKRKRRLSPN